MEFGILGPLRMTAAGRSYVPSAPKQRQLLAFLLLNANHVTSTKSCIEELWDLQPPDSALSTLQTYVLQLRRALALCPEIGSLRHARTILRTHDNGYQLVVGPGQLDRHVYEALVADGRAALARGDDLTASACFGDALALWCGDALADVKAGPLMRAHLIGLAERRTAVLEQRIEADLRLGRHHQIVGELAELAATHLTNENYHAQLMLALYRSGRQAQALESFQRLRTTLDVELGLTPSPRMRRLHQAVLSCDPTIDAPPGHDPGLTLDLAVRSG
ncbi:hypothetical protein GCM10023205_64100 [Yinghuangia aomiensis]|uniref:OmpR/PhoB-type domain-containing protein n=1 Tax=Yinghuangia aomiensis TaxID=676205 RepID=A0ABP9I2J9_9ACTN